MPTYEYECRKCGYQFERFQSITAAPVRTCPKCKGHVSRMLTTGSGIIFKGSGFYETDYKHQHASVEPSGGVASGEGTGTTGGEGKSVEKAAAGKAEGAAKGNAGKEGKARKKAS